MKKILVIALESFTLLTVCSWLYNMPVSAQRQQQIPEIVKKMAFSDRERRGTSNINLKLSAAVKVIDRDKNGKPQVSWRSLPDKSITMPGDIVRYTLSSNANSNLASTHLVVTQEIPSGTNYILSSARSINEALITYSIDDGKNFVEQPLIKVKMSDGSIVEQLAPAENYTHIRWQFESDLAPEIEVQASYDVKVE